LRRPFRLLPIFDDQRKQLPHQDTVETTHRKQIYCGDEQAKETQERKDGIDGFKARIAEKGDVSNKRNRHNHLRDDSSPRDHTMVALVKRLRKAAQPMNRIKLNRIDFTMFRLGYERVARFMD